MKFEISYESEGTYKADCKIEVEAETRDEALEKVKEMRRKGELPEPEYDYEEAGWGVY